MIEGFFHPKSLVVVGASRTPGKVGYEALRVMVENQKAGKFKGKLYAVNPKSDEPILGVPTYRSVLDLPEPVDLAVIVAPAKYCPSILEECGKRGIKRAIVISGGFAEVGGEGVKLQEELKEVSKRYGIRVIGPNCVGVVVPSSGVDTMFLPLYKEMNGKALESSPRPKPGHISLISQSGAFGVACLDYMYGEGIGLAKFVSYGNKVDVDEVDVLEYLARDPETRAILVYAESIDRGREFLNLAKRITKEKPIVVLKAGRTSAGAKAASSHTAALAGSDRIYEAAFKQAGVLRVMDMEELFDVAKALVMQPPARGDRVAILTDGGGVGVMASDEVESVGLKMARFSEETIKRLEQLKEERIIPPIAAIWNPVDLTGSATDESFTKALRILLEDNGVDAVAILALHHVPGLSSELPIKLAEIAEQYQKPVVAMDVGSSAYARAFREKFEEVGIPAYPEPERAIRALKGLIEFGRVKYGKSFTSS